MEGQVHAVRSNIAGDQREAPKKLALHVQGPLFDVAAMWVWLNVGISQVRGIICLGKCICREILRRRRNAGTLRKRCRKQSQELELIWEWKNVVHTKGPAHGSLTILERI